MKLQEYTYNKINYYVDYRLSQFRSISEDHGSIDFVDFDSKLGDRILCKMIKEGKANFGLLQL